MTLTITLAEGSLSRRIAVTLAALAAYRLGACIPLPGLNVPASLLEAGGSAPPVERISLMALGVIPLLSAVMLAEVAMMAWPKLRGWSRVPANGARLWSWLVLGALLIAAFQANGIAVALEQVTSGLVADPGLAFRAGVVGSLVASTAFVIWLASLITRHGIGYGMWILVAMPHVLKFTDTVLADIRRGGLADSMTAPLAIGYLALTIAAVLTLTRSRPRLADTDEVAWAPLLGLTLANWVLTGIVLIPWLLGLYVEPSGLPFGATGIVLTVLASISLVVALRRRSLVLAGDTFSAASAAPLAITAGGLILAGEVISEVTARPLFPSPATPLILAAVGLMIVEGLAKRQTAPALERDSQFPPSDPI
jgi:preprotein translocase subunit SecY